MVNAKETKIPNVKVNFHTRGDILAIFFKSLFNFLVRNIARKGKKTESAFSFLNFPRILMRIKTPNQKATDISKEGSKLSRTEFVW
ncbi:MAG: hypothetical protein ACFFCS_00415 [Candidatus Hodarchaeota archaeon]